MSIMFTVQSDRFQLDPIDIIINKITESRK